jgi:hypothetical protein
LKTSIWLLIAGYTAAHAERISRKGATGVTRMKRRRGAKYGFAAKEKKSRPALIAPNLRMPRIAGSSTI